MGESGRVSTKKSIAPKEEAIKHCLIFGKKIIDAEFFSEFDLKQVA